jgi:DNA-3-methyladenine glycosylase
MNKILDKKFFARDTLTISEELLGKFLVENISGLTRGHMITETEAYDGPDDLASHASKGKTPRNEIMFGEPAVWYVYLVYGMHFMLNIVTGPQDYPAAVLIRGILHADGRNLNGPAKLTKALSINKAFNTLPATPESKLWIEDHGIVIPKNTIQTSPRIGVDYAKEWKDKPYRFFIAKNT